jgi:hypothetical protein
MTGVRELGLPQGNALALPRATTGADAVVANPRYDIQFVQTVSIPSFANSNTISVPILLGGKAIQYFKRGDNGYIYRHTFDYAASGVTNSTATLISTGAGTAISQLPQVPNQSFNSNSNYLWSHSVSSTQTLFKYSALKPFLVTWDGVNDSSYVFPTDPSGITLSPNTDAFLLENGNLIVFGMSSSSNQQVFLAEYTSGLTFVRSMYLGNIADLSAGATTFNASVKKTSYGYVVGVTHVNGTIGARCMVFTLNKTCTSVIASRAVRLRTATLTTSLLVATVCGEEGVIFVSLGQGGGVLGSVNVPVLSGGTIPIVLAEQYYGGAQSLTAGTLWPHTALSGSIKGQGCTKYADTNAMAFFQGTSSSSDNPAGVLLANSASSSNYASIVDADLSPALNVYGTTESATIFPADVNRTIRGIYAYFQSSANFSTVNMAASEDGFMYTTYASNSAGYVANLFRKVSR